VADDLESLIRKIKPDWIFHLAAHGAYSHQTDLIRMIGTNLSGTASLLEACRLTGFSAFVQAGSSSEYGYQDHPPSETERPEPNSPYAVTKLAATTYSRYLAGKYRLPVRILRLYSIYGPYEEPTRLMPTLVVRALEGHLPPLVNPDIARDFVYVDDASEAFWQVARSTDLSPGEILNVGSGRQTTMHELVALACELFRITEKPCWGSMADRGWDTTCWVSDPRKITNLLPWKARTSLRDGLLNFADWFRANPDQQLFYTGYSRIPPPKW